MIVKQKNLRVFHIIVENTNDFIEYFNKNSVILKEFFLLLEGEIGDTIINLLDEGGICYKVVTDCNLRLGNVKKELVPEIPKEPKQETLFVQEKSEQKSVAIYDRPIRSGEEISEDVPVVVFGRINSGAKLFCSKSLSVYGEIDGLVQCDGEYLIVLSITPRGHVIFNGEIIDKELIKHDILQKISQKNGKIEIKEILH